MFGAHTCPGKSVREKKLHPKNKHFEESVLLLRLSSSCCNPRMVFMIIMGNLVWKKRLRLLGVQIEIFKKIYFNL